jgi:hypothetical protein
MPSGAHNARARRIAPLFARSATGRHINDYAPLSGTMPPRTDQLLVATSALSCSTMTRMIRNPCGCHAKCPIFSHSPRHQRKFRNIVSIMVPPPQPTASFPENKSVRSIAAKESWGTIGSCRGPLIAYAREGTSVDPPSVCKDFDMVDFRAIADLFRYPADSINLPQHTIPFRILFLDGLRYQLPVLTIRPGQ